MRALLEGVSLAGFREGLMLEPSGVRIKNYDRQLESLRTELYTATQRCRAASSKVNAAAEEHRLAKEHLEKLKVMNPLFRRGAHERDLKDAEERERCAIRASLAAAREESSAREEAEKLNGQIEEVEHDRRALENHMIDAEACYENNPESIIGMSQLWKCLERRIRLFKAEGPMGPVYDPIALIGNPGVGKTRSLSVIGGMLYGAGVLPSNYIYSISVKPERKDAEQIIESIDKDSRGILHVEASELVYAWDDPKSSEYKWNKDALEATNAFVRHVHEIFSHVLIVIECRPKTAEHVLAAFDDISGVFVRPNGRIICDDLESDDLIALLMSAVCEGREGAPLSLADDAAREELSRGLDLVKRTQGERFAHAKILKRLGDDLTASAIELGIGKTPRGEFIVTTEVVRSALEGGGWVPVADDKEDRECVRAGVIAELDELVGLRRVKEGLAKIERTLEYKRMLAATCGVDTRESMEPKPSFAFLGPAGTGKTTVARMMARLLYGIGVCDTDKLVVVNSSDLVAGYVGQSGPNTKKAIESARGGVLFIDEAYNLQASEGSAGGDFIDAVIQELLTAMTSAKTNVVFIFAGYEGSMDKFFNSNEGIKSRITNYVHFDSYSPEELAEIVIFKLEKDGFCLASASIAPLARLMTHISTLGEEYANARGAEKVAHELEDAKALLWERDSEGVDVREIDEGVIRQVMREHGIEAPTVCDTVIGPSNTVARDHGRDDVDDREYRSNGADKPAPAREVEAPPQCLQPSRDGDYKTLSGWIKAFKETGLSQTSDVDARKGPMAINEALEARGYITPKPSRRFTEKALTELDVREDERAGKTGFYVALLYSREAFEAALRIWRGLGKGHRG